MQKVSLREGVPAACAHMHGSSGHAIVRFLGAIRTLCSSRGVSGVMEAGGVVLMDILYFLPCLYNVLVRR